MKLEKTLKVACSKLLFSNNEIISTNWAENAYFGDK